MNSDPITVRQALKRGHRMITIPSTVILVTVIIIGIGILIWDAAWWELLLFPLAILLSILYTMFVTPRWREWACERVTDIHQLQRSAEMAGLLPKQSYDQPYGFMNRQQKQRWQGYRERFATEAVFIDDQSIPGQTVIGSGLTFSNAGISFNGAIFAWNDVMNERMITVSFHRTSGRTGMNMPAGSGRLFRFEYLSSSFEFPLSSLDIPAWELDLLLYIYRGRFGLNG